MCIYALASAKGRFALHERVAETQIERYKLQNLRQYLSYGLSYMKVVESVKRVLERGRGRDLKKFI